MHWRGGADASEVESGVTDTSLEQAMGTREQPCAQGYASACRKLPKLRGIRPTAKCWLENASLVRIGARPNH
ncbi:MAG TPA: hypothetical protein VKP30_28875 [Polyangiaceae bacterium]|nr:hypothetical protein [Polyangiaceae bacterium]